jgi:triacylglycerol lipase
MFRIRRAIFLTAMCHQAYRLLENGRVVLPAGYHLVCPLSARPPGGREEPYGFLAESRHDTVIAFRGTKLSKSFFDLAASLGIAQTPFPFVPSAGQTHSGFTELYRPMRKQLFRHLGAAARRKRLWITGHSLGGALAVYAALDLAANTGFRRPAVYTLGSPRAGSPGFAEAFNRRVPVSFRLANIHDPVPSQPLKRYRLFWNREPWKYRHVRTLKELRFTTGSWLRNHDHIHYYMALARLDPVYAQALAERAPGFAPRTAALPRGGSAE